jgi:Glutathione S-transferase, N-terminal domain
MIEYYSDATPNGLKVSVALEELGVPYNLHRVFLGGEQHTPEFTKLNPNTKIPVIVDDGFVLTESGAILIYLAEKTGKFLSKDPKARARTIELVMYQMASLGPMFRRHVRLSHPQAIDRESVLRKIPVTGASGVVGRHTLLMSMATHAFTDRKNAHAKVIDAAATRVMKEITEEDAFTIEKIKASGMSYTLVEHPRCVITSNSRAVSPKRRLTSSARTSSLRSTSCCRWRYPHEDRIFRCRHGRSNHRPTCAAAWPQGVAQ